MLDLGVWTSSGMKVVSVLMKYRYMISIHQSKCQNSIIKQAIWSWKGRYNLPSLVILEEPRATWHFVAETRPANNSPLQPTQRPTIPRHSQPSQILSLPPSLHTTKTTKRDIAVWTRENKNIPTRHDRPPSSPFFLPSSFFFSPLFASPFTTLWQ